MSPLPQRKRSPEELQQLREGLGIPKAQPLPAQTILPAAKRPPAPRPAHSAWPDPEELKRQEQVAAEQRARLEKRITRSLKRSNWEPAPKKVPQDPTAVSSALPNRRRTQSELEELQRREMLSRISAPNPSALFPRPASRFLIIPAYLLAFSIGVCHFRDDVPLEATAGAGALALLIAAWILFYRRLSTHHAGFISIITFLELIFAALHYFPQLTHAT